jgi:hypothetical protein
MLTINFFSLLLAWTGVQLAQMLAALLVVARRTTAHQPRSYPAMISIALSVFPLAALFTFWLAAFGGKPGYQMAATLFAGRTWLHATFFVVLMFQLFLWLLPGRVDSTVRVHFLLAACSTLFAALSLITHFQYR